MSQPERRLGRLRADSRGDRVFVAASALLALHVVVVAGVLWLPVAVVIGTAVVVLYLNRGRAVRTLLCAILGLLALADGLAVHLAHALLREPRPADVTGIAAALAGIALVALAYRNALRGRGWRAKILAVPVTLVVLQWYALPVFTAALATNAGQPDIPPAAELRLDGARDVSFPAQDGVRLSGWYVPGRGGAAVVLMHGSHGSRDSTGGLLRLLAGAGYGVLAFDARGHGQSAGQTNALGWQGTADVAGAVAFLRRQPGVDARRVAAVGLSMGGEEALRAASAGVPLAAVVADGAGASTVADSQLISDSPISSSITWLSMRATELFSGDGEPAALKDLVKRIDVPVLLVASNAAHEREIDAHYRDEIADAELWYVDDAGHTDALDVHPARYAGRVNAFLANALRAPGPQ